MAAKILKIGFAMGGGVSLGSFSGGGLSEVIKQAILNAGYYEEKDCQKIFTKYNQVVIDVFSGASAGSMSLAIMLRGLLHRTKEEEDEAISDLNKEGYNENNVGNRWDDLVAAQVVQNLQKKIWINEINLDVLLGETNTQKNTLTYEAGIVRRGALEKIAFDYFQMDEARSSNFSKRRILAEEVLFASTLSNLTGVVYRGGDETPKDPNYAGSHDPDTSESHKELRVFHLLFNEIKQQEIEGNDKRYPSKWIRYHVGPKNDHYIGDLTGKSAWARIVTTSMACGAFPFAFEPVPLERFKFEYGSDCWPSELTPEICALAMRNDTPLATDEQSFPFCYVDGGTFNNEPVREAFRMAAFLDSMADPDVDFDRVIVFVDPSVGDDSTNFRMPFAQQYSIHEPRKFLGSLEGYNVIQRNTLDRLIPHVFSLVNMITDEGRVKEANKIKDISDLFKKKEAYYEIFDRLSENLIDVTQSISAVLPILKNILETERLSEIVPVGTLTINGELNRVIKDQKSKFGTIRPFIELFTKDELNALPLIPKEIHHPLLMALLTIFMDMLMDLSGKRQTNKMIAIAPVVKNGNVYNTIDLPGGRLAAFSGFASKKANDFAVRLAIFCSHQLMKELKMLPEEYKLGDTPVWTLQDDNDFHTAFTSKLVDINDRIDNLFDTSHVVDIFPGVDNIILHQLSKLIKDSLAKMEWEKTGKESFRFMIEVGDNSMEIDGKDSYSDAGSFKIDGKLFLITELYYYPKKSENFYWNGTHAQEDILIIQRDGIIILPDRDFCSITLPGWDQVKKARLMPNPIFIYPKLTESDKGKILDASRWKIDPGLRFVEREILGKS